MAAAEGLFVHVYVDRATSRPVRSRDCLNDLFMSLRYPGLVPFELSTYHSCRTGVRARFSRMSHKYDTLDGQ